MAKGYTIWFKNIYNDEWRTNGMIFASLSLAEAWAMNAYYRTFNARDWAVLINDRALRGPLATEIIMSKAISTKKKCREI